ncbi:tetratricopeptide repeat protein [Nostoc sp. CMAA1605]|uniref:tetratricopeptide repeat protein n=1 Tax=Nostoc sp. CMAA1605 TaxID=2055159 RepID=UPI001F27A25F|nr:tetratricopeptide repeat protein [Nostoc sp. CMAA1605]MCF4967765.1 hypothetical protein [Nostoc sp. CMAA1605]
MSLLDNSFTTWVNRPYFDLGKYNAGALHIQAIEFSYNNLIADLNCSEKSILINPVTIIHPISFRESLIRESGLFQYQINNPLELADELRNERWQNLCNYLIHYQELSLTTQLRVLYLLSNLCLHHAVLEYSPKFSNTDIADCLNRAKIAYCRAMSALMARSDGGSMENLQELQNIANHTPPGSKIRLNAAIELVALSAKTFGDLNATQFWSSLATQELKNLTSSLDDFSYKQITSIYYRAVVFVPLLQKDREAVVREMDLCESLAESLIHEYKNEREQITAHENLITVLESRTKEALWLGDIDLAEARAKKIVEMEPFYSRYRLQLGEIFIKQGKVAEAAQMYRSAARLGPPGTAIAWFMAGQCHEKLGDLDIACDCYLASIQMDSLAISAVERLYNLAPRLGNSALLNWSNIRLSELREQQKAIASQPRTSYIPEASSALKKAGEPVMI